MIGASGAISRGDGEDGGVLLVLPSPPPLTSPSASTLTSPLPSLLTSPSPSALVTGDGAVVVDNDDDDGGGTDADSSRAALRTLLPFRVES